VGGVGVSDLQQGVLTPGHHKTDPEDPEVFEEAV